MKLRTKLLALLLCTAMLLTLLPAGTLQVSAYSETDIAYPVEGGNIYFDKATGTITDCDESVTSADIPAEIDGTAVTTIGDYAFYSDAALTGTPIHDELTSVTIPGSVESIGYCAFVSCDSLTSITIPGGVTNIGDYAFNDCDGLTSVVIGKGVESIGAEAFMDCSSLIGFWVDEANQYYCSDTSGILFNKEKTELIQCPGGYSGDYTIPDSIISIGDSAFYLCTSLTSVTIPDSVTSIGDEAFADCDSLTSVTIPDSVTSIGDSAFAGCYSLTSITIPGGVTSIGDGAFAECYSLTSIAIPGGVTSIGDYAFAYCDSLTSVTIPDSVTSIGDGAFKDCDSLRGIWVDEANQYYSTDASGV